MKAIELASKCKIRRSWLNELSRRGEVPGARQSRTGRWIYPDETAELKRFIKATRRRSDHVRRQQLNVTAADCEKRLRDERQNVRRAVAASERFPSLEAMRVVTRAKKKLELLKRELDSDYLSARDVAGKASCSQRRITKLALKIPGCERKGGRFIFKKSEDLLNWIRLDALTRNRAAKQRALRSWTPMRFCPNIPFQLIHHLSKLRVLFHKTRSFIPAMPERSRAQLRFEIRENQKTLNELLAILSKPGQDA